MDEERLDIDKTLGELTLEEKVRMLSGDGLWHTFGVKDLPRVRMSDGPNGLRMTDNGNSPAIPATCFPTLGMLANSWDPALVFGIGAAIGREATAMGVNLLLAPGVNIKRHPLGGRNFEYFSEDPLLSGDLGKAYISGVQSTGVGACVKHFAANNQEFMRMYGNSTVDSRALHDIYLKPFEIALKAEPAAVMCAYNKLNGEQCSSSRTLLTDELRTRYGYDGVVVSDWGAVRDRADALKAGLDLAMPDGIGLFEEQLFAALESGKVTEQDVDAALRRLLKLTDDVYLEPYGDFDADLHDRNAYNAAAASLVLLKNDGTLPLDKSRTLTVIGALAETAPIQGGGSSHVSPLNAVTPLDALDLRGAAYKYLQGYSENPKRNDRLLQEALKEYSRGVAVVFVGQPAPNESVDRKTLDLPPEQDALIDAILGIGRKVVVVLCGAGPVAMPWLDKVNAVIYAGLNGSAGALAAVDALFGAVNPCGRLAETFPVSVPKAIEYGVHSPVYRESIFVGYRYYDSADKPVLFPFGFGLSYSDIVYDGMRVKRTDDGFTVEATLTNNSDRDAYEVVQVYVSDRTGRVMCAKKQLAGYQKVFIEANSTTKANIRVAMSAFEFFDVKTNSFRVPNGAFELSVCSNVADVKYTASVNVGGDYTEFDNIPSTYTLPITGVFHNTDFKRIYGDELPPAPAPPKKGEYTLDCCLDDIKHTFIGKIMRKVVARRAKKMGMPGDIDREGFLASTMFTPLSAAAAMSDGALTLSGAKGIVAWANGHMFKGIKLLLAKKKDER